MNKNVLLCLLMIVGIRTAFCDESKLSIRIFSPLDIVGNSYIQNSNVDETNDKYFNFGFGSEVLWSFSNYTQIGVGLGLSAPYSISPNILKQYNILPVYACINVPLLRGDISPYLTGNIGWNGFINFKNDTSGYGNSGGLYYKLGGGILINLGNIPVFEVQKKLFAFVEGDYAESDGVIDDNNIKYNVEYRRFEIVIGIWFLN